MNAEIFRLYLDPAEIGQDGYPRAWHKGSPPIKDLVRENAGNRCVRCQHPYVKGNSLNSPRGEWSPCDDRCVHGGDVRHWFAPPGMELQPLSAFVSPLPAGELVKKHERVEAQWRILTVHHLNGIKADCRWWNLVSLCQRCHLTIQGKVYMERPWLKEHSDWFKPYVAGFYAWQYKGWELSPSEVEDRLDELLDLEHRQTVLL